MKHEINAVAPTAGPTKFADDPALKTRRSWRLLRRFVAGLAVLAVGLLGIYCYRWYVTETALQEAIAEVDRLDPGWRLAELEEKRVAIPPEQNSAPHVHKAGQGSIATLNIGTNRNDLGVCTEALKGMKPQTRLTLAQTEALRTALVPLATPLMDGRKIAGFPDGRYPFNTSPSLEYPLPAVDEANVAAWLLGADAMLHIQDGHSGKAWASCRAILNISRSFGDEPMAIAQAVRSLRGKDAVRLMERALAQGHVLDEELAESQKRLHEQYQYRALLIAVRSARAHLHHILTQVETGNIRMAELMLRADRTSNTPGIQDELRGFFSMHQAKPAHTWLLRYSTQAAELAKLPEKDAYPALQKLELTIAEAPDLARKWATPFSGLEHLRESRALAACACVGLAAERYRLKHGHWPSELADLVAERLLDEVLADPYDGKTVRYRKTADGVVIYSIGTKGDGRGEALGGEPAAVNDDRIEFQLWDGDKR